MGTIVEPTRDELWEARRTAEALAWESQVLSDQAELAAALLQACRLVCWGSGVPLERAIDVLKEAATDRDLPLPPSYEERVRDGLTPARRVKILDRDDYTCQACGSERWLQVDHIIPVSKGGSNAERNLQALCRDCNRAKGAREA